ncbi:hypothetical protein PGB90_010126 [Kerria lacca]
MHSSSATFILVRLQKNSEFRLIFSIFLFRLKAVHPYDGGLRIKINPKLFSINFEKFTPSKI